MLIVTIILYMFLVVDTASCEDLSLIEAPAEIKTDTRTESPVDQDASYPDEKSPFSEEFDQMQAFVKEENVRFKQIKLLSLDLEKAGLELKKKEVQKKIEDLERVKVLADGPVMTNEGVTPGPMVVLTGIVRTETYKKASLSVNGRSFLLMESESVLGVTLKEIRDSSVMIVYANGQEKEVALNG